MSIENNFEEAYFKELEIQRELEKIEIAYAKTLEKYKAYEECAGFVHFVKTIEKVFTEAKLRNWDAERSKEELIKIKIDMLAAESRLDRDIFQAIYNDFKSVSTDIDKVREVCKNLLAKYESDPECREFITYIEYVLINFQSASQMEDVKQGLIRSKMEVLSHDGHPELEILEKIYADFLGLLEDNKI
jgi:hypothetical protein